MRVERVLLEEFRNYARVERAFSPGITALVGPNGAGKTNVLEALHLVARGDSPRARDDAELVRWGAAVARVRVDIERAEDRRRVDLVLQSPPAGERRRPRRYLVDGAGRRADDALGELIVVAFFPEDVNLLADAPTARRRYLDAMIGQADRAHRADVRGYQRVLEQRNALLRALRDEAGPDITRSAELAFWDAELCRLGGAIADRRARAVEELRPEFRRAAELFSGTDEVDVAYVAQAAGASAGERAIAYGRLLSEKRERELWQATTLVGPHREDLAVTSRARPLPAVASRGEQRSAVLSLKLAEASWLRERSGDLPVFLLDDVLSELDPARRAALFSAVPEEAQILVTAALPAGLPDALLERAALVPVRAGLIG